MLAEHPGHECAATRASHSSATAPHADSCSARIAMLQRRRRNDRPRACGIRNNVVVLRRWRLNVRPCACGIRNHVSVLRRWRRNERPCACSIHNSILVRRRRRIESACASGIHSEISVLGQRRRNERACASGIHSNIHVLRRRRRNERPRARGIHNDGHRKAALAGLHHRHVLPRRLLHTITRCMLEGIYLQHYTCNTSIDSQAAKQTSLQPAHASFWLCMLQLGQLMTHAHMCLWCPFGGAHLGRASLCCPRVPLCRRHRRPRRVYPVAHVDKNYVPASCLCRLKS